LGAKPVRGGRPPRERRMSGARPANAGNFAHEVARVLILVEPEVLNARNVAEVMIMYVRRARTVMEGLNWSTRIIHPRWAIDE